MLGRCALLYVPGVGVEGSEEYLAELKEYFITTIL